MIGTAAVRADTRSQKATATVRAPDADDPSLPSAQREAVAVREEMLVGALEVSAGADGHQRYRIVTAVEQPLVGRPASLDLVRCERKASWVQLARSVGECGSLAATRA